MVVELQYADDAAVVASSVVSLQRNLDALETAYTRAGLSINIDKTEALPLLQADMPPSTFHSNGVAIKNVDTFIYLGSVLNSKGNIDDDVHRRITLASSASW